MLSFRRVTSSGKFVPEIDGLRFVAVAAVVLYHLSGFLPNEGAHLPFHTVIAHGYRGVDLFFVISGFILGLPFASHYHVGAQPVSLKAYFARRLTRLEPPYILNLLICFGLVVITENANPRTMLPHFGASLLYLHNLVYGAQSTINAVAWTLEVEVQFYCLMPALAVLFSIRPLVARRVVLLAVIMLAGIVQVVFWSAPQRVIMSILFAIQFFLAGMLLADLYIVDWRERPSCDWRWDVLSIGLWPVVFLMPDRPGWVFFPIIILLLYVGAFRGVFFRKVLRSSVLTAIGGMCYTIYLFHWQLIHIVMKNRSAYTGAAEVSFRAALFFLTLAGVSCAFFLLIERPCMKRNWPGRLMPPVSAKDAGQRD